MMSNAQILVIDDDPHLRRAIVRILTTAGYNILEAATGAEGLQLAADMRPDLILLDVVLPDISGLEVCRRFKNSPEYAGTYVVLLSGVKTSSDHQSEGLDIGADGYIVRPIEPRELVARVRAMLRIKHAEDELTRYRDHLEDLVNARTTELAETNQRLQQEIAKHHQTERELDQYRQHLEDLVEERTAALRQEIEEHKHTAEALHERERCLRALLENAENIIVIQNRKGQYIYYNGSPQFALKAEEVIGKTPFDLHEPSKAAEIMSRLHQVINNKEPLNYEQQMTWNGKELWFENYVYPIRVNDGSIEAVGTICHNITTHKQMKAQLETSLNEKEVLLREIHHRVKNNLQVVSSLLYLQMEATNHEQTREVLQESQNRILSMSMVHEQLYRSINLAEINIAEYTEGLINHLLSASQMENGQVSRRLDVEPILLSIDQAIPYGLLLQEILSNVLKHGFVRGEQGEITISFHAAQERLFLIVINTGVSFPGDLHFQAPPLELELIKTFVMQLGGVMELNQYKGTRFTISFPKK